MPKTPKEPNLRETLTLTPEQFRDLAAHARDHGDADAASENREKAFEAEARSRGPKVILDSAYAEDLGSSPSLSPSEQSQLKRLVIAAEEGTDETFVLPREAYDPQLLEKFAVYAEASGDTRALVALQKLKEINETLEALRTEKTKALASGTEGAEHKEQSPDFWRVLEAVYGILKASEVTGYDQETVFTISDADKVRVMQNWDQIIATIGTTSAKEFVRRLSHTNDEGQLSIQEASDLRDEIVRYERTHRPQKNRKASFASRVANVWSKRPRWLGGTGA